MLAYSSGCRLGWRFYGRPPSRTGRERAHEEKKNASARSRILPSSRAARHTPSARSASTRGSSLAATARKTTKGGEFPYVDSIRLVSDR